MISLPQLPECKHRGPELRDGCFACSSNWLVHASDCATAAYCVTCRYANRENRPPREQREIPQPPKEIVPAEGPGTELKAIIASLGVTPTSTCGCESLANEMNMLGVDGCRRERERLVSALREKREAFGLEDTVKAAALAFANGLAWRINWKDPLPDLFDVAVRRAEELASNLSTSLRDSGLQSQHEAIR